MILCPNRLPESERVCPGICKRHDMNLQTGAEEVIRLLPEHHVQQIGLYEKTQKKGNNNGI